MSNFEYYTNRGINVLEQVAHQRGLPFINRDYATEYLANINEIEEEQVEGYTLFNLTTNNPLAKPFTIGRVFILKLFYKEPITNKILFKINNQKYIINLDFILKNNTFYYLKIHTLYQPQTEETEEVYGIFDIEDAEGFSTNPTYYNYYTVDKCINSAIYFAENYVGYKIISKHIELTSDIEDYKDRESYLKTQLKIYQTVEIVRNIEYIYEEILENNVSVKYISQINFDIGFETLPEDLKKAIMNCATSFYIDNGDLIQNETQNNRISFANEDVSKNILYKYKKKGF